MSESVVVGAPGGVRLAGREVFAGRAAEQVALAGASVLLAARLGPVDFAPVGVLMVLASLALTAADLGVGMRVLRLPAGGQVDERALRRVRALNLVIAAVAVAIALAVESTWGVLLGVAGLLWGLGAEATIRKSAALRAGSSRSVARSEILGALALLAGVAAASVDVDGAAGWVGAGLAAKALLEVTLVRPWRWAFGRSTRERDWFDVWLSQVLAYAIANLDYVVIGLVLGERALSTYVLAFRISNAVPSQVAFVVARMATVDLASGERSERQARYHRYTLVLFSAGAAGAVATVGASPVLGLFLGSDWHGASWAVAILALAAPWRTVLGTAGTLAIIGGAVRQLVGWEVGRLVLLAAALLVGASLGFPWFLATAVLASVVSVLLYHHLAGQVADVTPWAPLRPAAAVTVTCLILLLVVGLGPLGDVT